LRIGEEEYKKGIGSFLFLLLVGMSVSESKDAVRREKNP